MNIRDAKLADVDQLHRTGPIAAGRGHGEMVEFLLEHGADAGARDNHSHRSP